MALSHFCGGEIVDTYQQRIERDGFCVIEQVIPEAVVGDICAELAAAVEHNRQHSDAKLAEIRRRGHRIGTPGVAQFKQVYQSGAILCSVLGRPSAPSGHRVFFRGLGADFLHRLRD